MQCPSCGALHDGSINCEGTAPQWVAEMATPAPDSSSLDLEINCQSESVSNDDEVKQTSRLIEFPGVTRSSLPGWRKEISERVREVQERRAREAAAEAAEAANGITVTDKQTQLELLPQAETPPLNPLVAAALKRIERAHSEPAHAMSSSRSHARAAVAYVADRVPDFAPPKIERHGTALHDSLTALDDELKRQSVDESTDRADSNKTSQLPHLVVVPPVTPAEELHVEEPPIAQPSIAQPTIAQPSESPVVSTRPVKPRRIISDDGNNPALNYLDSIHTAVRVDSVTNHAPVFRRLLASFVDLVVLTLLNAPMIAAANSYSGDWLNFQVIGTLTGVALVIVFLYSTISVALTGRTLGMRLFGIRVVDMRTGLIPTGKQSAGRALLYLASLLSAGILLALALVDSERQATHDRVSRTAVVRA
jgi:uncharacterized RDD family membrane protein YckC